jgi:hypothetical protein
MAEITSATEIAESIRNLAKHKRDESFVAVTPLTAVHVVTQWDGEEKSIRATTVLHVFLDKDKAEAYVRDCKLEDVEFAFRLEDEKFDGTPAVYSTDMPATDEGKLQYWDDQLAADHYYDITLVPIS